MSERIIITGAESGIGKDAAFALAKNGHYVIACAKNIHSAEALQAQATRKNITLRVEVLDITNEHARTKIQKWNGTILINNAGVGESGPLAEIPLEHVRTNFEVNVFGTLHLTQLFLQKQPNNKRVIFITSVAGLIVPSYLGAYCMTKFALEAAADALRREMRHLGTHVSIIEPGAIDTGFNERMNASKYKWFNTASIFWSEHKRIQKAEKGLITNQASTEPIVNAIMHAVQSSRPKVRYLAPAKLRLPIFLAKIAPTKWVDAVLNRLF